MFEQEMFDFDDWNWLKKELVDMEESGKFNTKETKINLKNPPKIASFFAGAGGMDLGLHWAGFKSVYANEIDSSACETYKLNFDIKPDNSSILNVDISAIPDHDILVGGFPCQPFSYAGKRKGLVDERGLLFFALIEDLYIKSPSFFIFENLFFDKFLGMIFGFLKGVVLIATFFSLMFFYDYFDHIKNFDKNSLFLDYFLQYSVQLQDVWNHWYS